MSAVISPDWSSSMEEMGAGGAAVIGGLEEWTA